MDPWRISLDVIEYGFSALGLILILGRVRDGIRAKLLRRADELIDQAKGELWATSAAMNFPEVQAEAAAKAVRWGNQATRLFRIADALIGRRYRAIPHQFTQGLRELGGGSQGADPGDRGPQRAR